MRIKVGISNVEDPQHYKRCAIFGLNENKKCLQPGYDSEILGYILNRLNISYETILIDDGLGRYVNGTWSGTMGKIYNRDIDTMIGTAIATKLRRSYFDFTSPIGFEGYVFIFKKVDDSFETNLKNILQPFEAIVWLSFACLCLILLITGLATRAPQYTKIHTSIWDFLQTLFNQCEPITTAASKKILFVASSIMIIVFSALYQNVLLLNVIKSKEIAVLSSLSDLAELLKTNRIKIVTDNDKWAFFESIQFDSIREEFIQIKNAICERDKIILVANESLVIRYLKTGKYVYPVTLQGGLKIMQTHCDLSYVEIKLVEERLGYVFPKNSSLTSLVNSVISSSYAMIDYYSNKYKLKVDSNCAVEKNITLIKLSGPILLIATGLSIAALIFAVEILKSLLHFGS